MPNFEYPEELLPWAPAHPFLLLLLLLLPADGQIYALLH